MQFKVLATAAALLGFAFAAPAVRRAECFPATTHASVQSLQESINKVISDLSPPKYATIGADYAAAESTLSGLEHGIVADGCAADLPSSATTSAQAIAYLQAVQAELMVLNQDAFNGNCENGKKSVCRSVNLFDAVADYVDSVSV